MGREIEFKFRVRDEAALDRFAAGMGFDRGRLDARLQANHFFDSADARLRAARVALRLRLEGDRAVITVKGKALPRAEGTALTERFEAECEVSADLAEEILAGRESVLSPLEQARTPGLIEAHRRVRQALGDAPLAYLGGFENQRTTLPPIEWSVGGNTERLVFELDRTRFPRPGPEGGERVDCEIELEISGSADAAALLARLEGHLAEMDLAWQPAPSKLQRFLEVQGLATG